MERRPQTFANYTKWDPLFHFILAPVLLFNIILAARHMWAYPAYTTVVALVIAVALFLINFKTRVNALKVQDRLIRLEERTRMKELLSAATFTRTSELAVKQYVALRFASDAELPALVEKTLNEKLTPKQIKQAIQNWRPDYDRV